MTQGPPRSRCPAEYRHSPRREPSRLGSPRQPSTPKTARPRLRWLVWPTVLAVAATVVIAERRADAIADIGLAKGLLVAGQAEEAMHVLGDLESCPFTGPQARMGLRILEVYEDPRDTVVPTAAPTGDERSLDPAAFPLPLVVRAAFERGDFDAALRLTQLAEEVGQPTVAALTAAALIEDGRDDEVEDPPTSEVSSLLVQRVAHHLASEERGGVLLRDRRGIPIGRVVGGELELEPGVEPALVPEAVVRLAEVHPDAGALTLSLDLELSRLAYGSFGRYRGSIVLLDPVSGEILTAVSDRRTSRAAGDPALEQFREPASIAKLITTTAYRRAGLDPDAELQGAVCRGHVFYDGKPVYCPNIAGRLGGLDRAMAVSCNVAFAELGVQLGRDRLMEEFRRYGFGRSLGVDAGGGPFPGGRLHPIDDDRQLADLAIGLEESELTPLHAALLAAVMANGGVRPEPTLLRSADSRLGLHRRSARNGPGRRVLDAGWMPQMLGAMEAVVARGTAMRVRTRGFPVVMKTGTASHPRWGFHVNYIGAGPMPDPRVAFCVRVTDQRTSRRVRSAAQEVTGHLLRRLRSVQRKRGWSEPRIQPVSPLRVAEERLPTRIGRPGERELASGR
ncbi:MAG: penicillin-binding transpeptidase domain-containing protein [Acidobacteriota bacterium]